ncbi:FAD/NAD(P)-binding protein [Gilvimarinus sp. DA14]|uniref:FAD/NAD(P)-binding protein n=1 Tax=Gilvimarinus sp. DA14 TaxID=2956798 RepID=UPI0020B643BA|nr:FAD/NAD(P)-binding protein [Gilvimarinus sp. DA14]UTF59019.1 FAD/NAD(P)-binding protein [Gilvimarinus sp. DA14]
MQRIAIIGSGPTGLYTLAGLIECGVPLSITLYESRKVAGVGMPFDEHNNHSVMLANIASIEIPPLACSYLDWLQDQSHVFLSKYRVKKESLHDRQFLPRVLLGHYFHNQLQRLIERGQNNGHHICVQESSTVVDLDAQSCCRLWVEGQAEPAEFDFIVVATGHSWPSESKNKPGYFASPWSGLIESDIPAASIGIRGASLSGIDAAMAVAVQHGHFVEQRNSTENDLQFKVKPASVDLNITLMSRSGILPEADFYCPIPHQPLTIATPEAVSREIGETSEGLLDRVFSLMVRELQLNAPEWSERIALQTLNANNFPDAYFLSRKEHNPFNWAKKNLDEVIDNKRNRHTVAWRYTLLRLHEAIEPAVTHFNAKDRQRFKQGLKRVFIDNYAAVPPESIRRILALRRAGVIDVKALGDEYELETRSGKTIIQTDHEQLSFDVFIEARGQKAASLEDFPFPRLRNQLLKEHYTKPPINDDFTLALPNSQGERIALVALPYLMPIKPFVQGITVCAEMAEAVSKSFIARISQSDLNERKLDGVAND